MATRIRKAKSTRSSRDRLRLRLVEAIETLEAIRSGAVDALVVQGEHGEQVFTLKGADQVYRVLVDAMNEGAVSLSHEDDVLYCNSRFAEMVRTPAEEVVGTPFCHFVSSEHRNRCSEFLKRSLRVRGTLETVLVPAAENRHDGSHQTTVVLSSNPFPGAADIGCSLVITDITDRKQIEVAQREAAKKILAAQEQERHRVSRELHDGISQLLSSARHRLHDVQRQAERHGDARLTKNVIATRDLLERTLNEVRLISRNLRPSELDDLGLGPAIASLVEEFEARRGIRARYRAEGASPALPPQTELALYRIVQEALNNVGKHAEASLVSIELTRKNGVIRLRIRDDGRGFKPEARTGGGLGLLHMRERASMIGGTLSIVSAPRRGTEIFVEAPH